MVHGRERPRPKAGLKTRPYGSEEPRPTTAASALQRVAVYVVLPPRTLLLDVAGPGEVLRRANLVQDRVRFDVHFVAPSSSIVSSIGLTLSSIDPLPAELPDDAMVMLVGNVDERMSVDPRVAARVDSRDDAAREAAIVDWLETTINASHTLVTICSGAMFAARAGLFDGYACTTHYSDCEALAKLAPRANVLDNRLFVQDRSRWSSAGVTAGIDLMLHVISHMIDHATAAAIARYLVVYLRRSGTDPQLSPWLEGRNHIHPAVHRLQDAMAADPTRAWTLMTLSRVAGASARHLSRLFNAHAGMSIADYRVRLRVAVARELLGHTDLDMEHVAERAGFQSTRQLRRAWRRFYATPPKEARVTP
jgi:transcriptional regulator GlxA family with amidase domain